MNTDSGPRVPEFLLNNQPVSVYGSPVHSTLLDFIRQQGLTGAKEGCAEGECGACTVLLVADRDGRSEYRAVNSCLMLAPMAAGHEIYTVEALADGGAIAEVQAAMAAGGGSQCGYCTPGFVVSLFAEQYRPGRAAPCNPQELGGNLCRCTGYRPIRDAALSIGPPSEGVFLERLSRPAPKLDALEYQVDGLKFSRPRSLEDCLEILADPRACLISGGTDLTVEANLRGRRWPHLVSLEAVPELRAFSETQRSVTIGAALSLNDLASLWRNAPAVFRHWLPLFASPTLRNRATLGGNLATASPIGDSAPLLLALDASLHLASRQGRRTLPLSEFFTGYRRTALSRDELIAAIEIPKPLPEFIRFYKVAKRRMDDISTVAAAMALSWDREGRISLARFAFGGVAATPIRATEAEDAVAGRRWNHSTAGKAQSALGRMLSPIGDHRGSAQYRLAVARSLISKFLWEWRQEAA